MKVFLIGGVTVSKEEHDSVFQEESAVIHRSMRALGKGLIQAAHDLLVCSPLPDSADYAAFLGAAEVLGPDSTVVQFHFPGDPKIGREIQKLIDGSPATKVLPFKCQPPINESPEGWRDAWLLAQLDAMRASNVVIAIGGKPVGSSSLTLLLAEGEGKSVLPLTFLEGAAGQSFQRLRYQLADRLRGDLPVLSDPNRIGEVVPLLDAMAGGGQSAGLRRATAPRFFISYAHSRPHEADLVETVLRRRGVEVLRDEQDFGPGNPLPGEVRESIYKSDVFVCLWSSEYACSPWCYDELALALDRHKEGSGELDLWIFCVDDTRMVPPGARHLINFRVRTREELEGAIVKLLARLMPISDTAAASSRGS